jgi:hypothetical protein
MCSNQNARNYIKTINATLLLAKLDAELIEVLTEVRAAKIIGSDFRSLKFSKPQRSRSCTPSNYGLAYRINRIQPKADL